MDVQLLTNLDNILLGEDDSTQIHIKYEEKKRWLRSRVDGSLTIDVLLAKGLDADVKRTFPFSFEVTQAKGGAKGPSESEIYSTIAEHLISVADNIDLLAYGHLTPEQMSDVRQQLFIKTASVMQMPPINKECEAALQRIHVKAEEIRHKELDSRRKKLSESVRDTLEAYEADALYQVNTEASRGLQYEVPKDRVIHRSTSLFDPDDNLQDRPLMNGNNSKGSWARFVKENLGEGYHIKLRNIENDLDSMYISVMEAVAEKVAEGAELSQDLYEKTFVETISLEKLLLLLEREKEVYTEVLTQFKTVKDRGPYSFASVFPKLVETLNAENDIVIPIPGKAKGFRFPEKQCNNVIDFERAVEDLTATLTKYLQENVNAVLIVDDNQSISRDDTVAFIRNGSVSGDYGRIYYFQRHDYGTVVNIADNGKLRVKFELQCNQTKDLYVVFGINKKFVKRASRPTEPYAEAAKSVIERQVPKCLDKCRSDSAAYTIKRINEFHPYLEDQLKFRHRFHAGMVKRFEQMYTKHTPKQLPASTQTTQTSFE